MGHGWLSFIIFPLIAFVFSANRKKIDYKFCMIAFAIQVLFCFLIHKVAFVQEIFMIMSRGINHLKMATCEGTKFVFGYLGGYDCPFETKDSSKLFIFAFQALPMIIVISAISMLLFYWKVLPMAVRFFAFFMQKTLNIGGALGLCTAAKLFLGQTDAPLLIRPYISKLTRSELFSVMTAGMATTAASAMPIYASILDGYIANPLSHILAASFISIPAALIMSRIIEPEVSIKTEGDLAEPYEFSSSMDAISKGTGDGMQLYLSLIAILIVSLALVKLANIILAEVPTVFGSPLSLERCAAWFMAPVTWVMGIAWDNAFSAGELLGTKTIMNEIIAFLQMQSSTLPDNEKIIMLYALCGFANLSSIGIQIAGLGTMAPSRRSDIVALAPKALLAGTLASCLSGAMVGVILGI